MKPHDKGLLNTLGKAAAKPLSCLVANSIVEGFSRLAEAYWCVLLGKGAGTGWAMDAEITAAKKTIKNSSPVIFDIGAYIGEWSFLMHRAFPQAQIFMFEPQPNCKPEIMAKNIPNATLIPCAVSSAKGPAKLHTCDHAAYIASLHPRLDSYFKKNQFIDIEVNTVTIDDMVKEHALERIDFLKMDIEGHELEALKGAAKSLEHGVILALSFEFGSGNINSRTYFRDFFELLNSYNYAIYRILPSRRLLPIQEYYEDCEYFRGVTNYIAKLR